VQIAGLRSVQSGYLGGNVVPRSGSSPLEGLKYRWFTTKRDELQITANATVEYDFKSEALPAIFGRQLSLGFDCRLPDASK
jgi:hypothetical protein